MKKNKQQLIIIFLWFFIFFIVIFSFNIFDTKQEDLRDQHCKWKVIQTVEYNFENKSCTQIEISACLEPIYKDIDDCEKQNWLK